MFHALLKDYILYVSALPIGFAVSVGLCFISLGRGDRRLLQALERVRGIRPTFLRKYRSWLAGLMFIALGLVVFSLVLLEEVSTRGTLLTSWTLGFVLTCVVVTLVFAVPLLVWLQRQERRWQRPGRPALSGEQARIEPLRQRSTRPQPKEAREE